MSNLTAKQQLIETKKSVHDFDDFHGNVEKLSESYSELSQDMCWLLDALEKAHPAITNTPEFGAVWKNALSATKLADRLSQAVVTS